MKDLLPDHYTELTTQNFFVLSSSGGSTCTRIGSVSGTENNPLLGVTYSSGLSYNSSTGIVTINGWSATAIYDNWKSVSANGSYTKAVCVYPAP